MTRSICSPTTSSARPPKSPQLYKERWEIELLFKWLKQNLKIRRFLGRSENAVRTQIYVALIAFLLLRILHQTLARSASNTAPALLLARLKIGLLARSSLSQHATLAAQTTGAAPAQPANLLRFPMTPITHKIPDSSARKRESRVGKAAAVAPGPRFRGGDDNPLQTRNPFWVSL